MKIDISIGELVDRVTICGIKLERIEDPAKKAHVRKEFDGLSRLMTDAGIPLQSDEYARLKRVNETLWDIENSIRVKEAAQEFDDAFIHLARQVYRNNDERSRLKKEINLKFKSEWIEEKEYAEYPAR
jgi:hypothetical protein